VAAFEVMIEMTTQNQISATIGTKSNRNSLRFAFLMVASLFFIWGFCHAMLDVLNSIFRTSST